MSDVAAVLPTRRGRAQVRQTGHRSPRWILEAIPTAGQLVYKIPEAAQLRGGVQQRLLDHLLALLAKTGEAVARQGALAKALGTDRTVINKAAKRLRELGLIDYEPGTDPRGGDAPTIWRLGEKTREALRCADSPPPARIKTIPPVIEPDGLKTILGAAAGAKPVSRPETDPSGKKILGDGVRSRRDRREVHPVTRTLTEILQHWQPTEGDVNTLDIVAWCWADDLRSVLAEITQRVSRWDKRPHRLGAAVRCEAKAYLLERGLPIPEPLRKTTVTELARQRARALITSRGESAVAVVDEVEFRERQYERGSARATKSSMQAFGDLLPTATADLCCDVAEESAPAPTTTSEPDEDEDSRPEVQDDPVPVRWRSRDGQTVWVPTPMELDQLEDSYCRVLIDEIRPALRAGRPAVAEAAREAWAHGVTVEIAPRADGDERWILRQAVRRAMGMVEPTHDPDPKPEGVWELWTHRTRAYRYGPDVASSEDEELGGTDIHLSEMIPSDQGRTPDAIPGEEPARVLWRATDGKTVWAPTSADLDKLAALRCRPGQLPVYLYEWVRLIEADVLQAMDRELDDLDRWLLRREIRQVFVGDPNPCYDETDPRPASRRSTQQSGQSHPLQHAQPGDAGVVPVPPVRNPNRSRAAVQSWAQQQKAQLDYYTRNGVWPEGGVDRERLRAS